MHWISRFLKGVTIVKETEYSAGFKLLRSAAVPQYPGFVGSMAVALRISVMSATEMLLYSGGSATASSSDQYNRVSVGLQRNNLTRGAPLRPAILDMNC